MPWRATLPATLYRGLARPPEASGIFLFTPTDRATGIQGLFLEVVVDL